LSIDLEELEKGGFKMGSFPPNHSNSKKIFLALIEKFHYYEIDYCVLRGYVDLPDNYHNDIDLGIDPYAKDLFFEILKKIKIDLKLNILLIDTRFEVLKTKFSLNNSDVFFDFWFDFNYIGVKYVDIKKVLERAIFYNDFKIASYKDEIEISFLKELLHMKRLRADKVLNLQNKICKSTDVFADFFCPSMAKKFNYAIRKKMFKLNKLSNKAKRHLLIFNIKSFGFLNTSRKIITFLIYRIFPSINPINKKFSQI
jgi:hypothetical protein